MWTFIMYIKLTYNLTCISFHYILIALSFIYYDFFWRKHIVIFTSRRVFQHSNQNRCIGNCKADKCDDLPDLDRTLTMEI